MSTGPKVPEWPDASPRGRRGEGLRTGVVQATYKELPMAKYRWDLSGLYIESGVVEAEDEQAAQHYAEQYARDQFSDALAQAYWSFERVDDDAAVDAP